VVDASTLVEKTVPSSYVLSPVHVNVRR
jgi:hypothetical protein